MTCFVFGVMIDLTTAKALAAITSIALVVAGCNGNNAGAVDDLLDISEIPVPPPDGPRLASIGKTTSIHERPSANAKLIGSMRAGATVARAEEPVSTSQTTQTSRTSQTTQTSQTSQTSQCPGGWYPIYPRGFVCAGQDATTNLAHPTLSVMKTKPSLSAILPYQYFSATTATSLYEWDRDKEAAVIEIGKLRRRSRFAVVGSWTAQLPNGRTANLAMMPDGNFVNAAHIEESSVPSLRGVVLDDASKLPVAFAVKQGIRLWALDGNTAVRGAAMEPHTIVSLTGKYRTVGDIQFWATQDGSHVRHQDVTMVRRRESYPSFVVPGQKWIDVSVIAGTVVLYEGKKPVYVTLCSVGSDRLGNPDTSPATRLGTFEIVGKHITMTQSSQRSQPGSKPFADDHDAYDVPWVHVLSSGQMIHGAMWHGRFGVEHGPGNVQLSPYDAAHLFAWSSPSIPDGWHSVIKVPDDEAKVIVLIRK